jgi:peptide/nickel transport system substrate-binding protein
MRLNRRDFLRHTAMVGLGGASAALLTGGPLGSVAFAQGDEPAQGGVLSMVLANDPPNFDIISQSTSMALNVLAPCYNGLVMFDPLDPDAIIGDLAESWDISEDGTVYTFHLVKNAKFHDGHPLTSADAKYSFDIMRDPPEGVVSLRKATLGAVKSIDAPDDYTVTFTLNEPSSSFLTNLATGWMLVMPKHIMEKTGSLKDQIVGSGPFRLKQYTRGVSVELERNPDYHVAGQPYLDGITGYIVPEYATVHAYFRTGQILLFDEARLEDIKQIRDEMGDGALTFETEGLTVEGIWLNSTHEPLNDVRVRKAIHLGHDRREGIEVVLHGGGVVGGLLPPGRWALPQEQLAEIAGYSTDMEANRAEARKLLAEAGFPDGFAMTITTRRAASFNEARAVYMQDQMAKIGIKLDIRVLETASYYDALARRDFDMITVFQGGLANDPDLMLADYYTCSGAQNLGGLCVDRFDELFAVQRGTMDFEARKAIVNEMEELALNEYMFLVEYWKKKYLAVGANVHNLILHPEPDNNRRFQTVWLSPAA